MTDIVERLRTEAQEICADTYPRWKNADETMDEAADEIERLRAELNDVSLERAWAERNAAVAELHNYKEVGQAREAKLRGALVALDEYYTTPGEDDWVRFLNDVLTPAREVLRQTAGD